MIETLLALGLAAVHLFTSRIRTLTHIPRAAWLSFAGGISLAYVFLHLLPEIGEGQEVLVERYDDGLFFGFGIYALALAGLLAFYILERLAEPEADAALESEPGGKAIGLFAVHLALHTVYSLIIGYLITHRPAPAPGEAVTSVGLYVFVAAMALHILVSDAGLSAKFGPVWHRVGRWVLAAAILVGFGLGMTTDLSESGVAALTAVLGGGVILNVLKEELPKEKQSRLVPLLLGVVCLGGILAVESVLI